MRARTIATLTSLTLLCAGAAPGALEAGEQHQLRLSSTNAAGTMASAGGWTLTGLAGQPEAERLVGPHFELVGGLLAAELGAGLIFADGFESGDTSAWSLVEGASHE